MRELGARLAGNIGSRQMHGQNAADPSDTPGPRRRNVFAALLVAAAGVAIAYGIMVVAQGGSLVLPRSLHLPQVISDK